MPEGHSDTPVEATTGRLQLVGLELRNEVLRTVAELGDSAESEACLNHVLPLVHLLGGDIHDGDRIVCVGHLDSLSPSSPWLAVASDAVVQAARDLPEKLSRVISAMRSDRTAVAMSCRLALRCLSTIRAHQLLMLCKGAYPAPVVPESWPRWWEGVEGVVHVLRPLDLVWEEEKGEGTAVYPHVDSPAFTLLIRISATDIARGVEVRGGIKSIHTTHDGIVDTWVDGGVDLSLAPAAGVGRTVDVLVMGEARSPGYTTMVVDDPACLPTTPEGRGRLVSRIGEIAKVRGDDVVVESKGGRVVVVSFPHAKSPRVPQGRLLRTPTPWWHGCEEGVGTSPDVTVLCGRRRMCVAVCGRTTHSGRVHEELYRQKMCHILCTMPCEKWRRAIVSFVHKPQHDHPSAQFRTSPYTLELLWCLVGGVVDISDYYERLAIVQSMCEQRYVANPRPSDPDEARRHRLYHPNVDPTRQAAVAINSEMLRCIPELQRD